MFLAPLLLIPLALAASPDIPPDGASEPPASAAPSPEEEIRYQRALRLLHSYATGEEGARQLGLMRDPRAVGPLLWAALNQDEATAVAATLALASYPASLSTLASWLSDPQVPPSIRYAAVEAIGLMGTAEAELALIEAVTHPHISHEIYDVIVETLDIYYPQRVPQLRYMDTRQGRGWSAVAGAWLGGSALMVTALAVESDLTGAAAVAGTAGGAVGGWLTGDHLELTAKQGALIATSGATGSVAGLLIMDALFPASPSTSKSAGALAAECVGLGLGAGLSRTYTGLPEDIVEAQLLGAFSALAAGTVTAHIQTNRPDYTRTADTSGELVAGAALVGGLLVGHQVAPQVDLERGDRLLMALATGYGALAGGTVPLGSRERYGLTWTGLGLGGLVGYGVASHVNVYPSTLALGGGGLLLGGLGGLSASMLADLPSDQVRLATLGGGTLGMVGGLAWGHRRPRLPSSDDMVLSSVATGWAAWQAIGWVQYTGTQATAGPLMVLGPTAVGLATITAAPLWSVPPSHTLAVAATGTLGAYAGLALSRGLEPDEPILLPLVLSDAGLLASAALLAPPFRVQPATLGSAAVGGALGSTLAIIGTSTATSSTRKLMLASSIGLGAGMAGGVVGHHFWRQRSPKERALLLPRPSLPPPMVGWHLSPTSLWDGEQWVQGVQVQREI